MKRRSLVQWETDGPLWKMDLVVLPKKDSKKWPDESPGLAFLYDEKVGRDPPHWADSAGRGVSPAFGCDSMSEPWLLEQPAIGIRRRK